MKYTVDGLSQDYLVSKQCDSTDVLLLSYLIWLMSNDTIKKKIVNNKVYHWINYDKVIEYMPILQLKKELALTIFLGIPIMVLLMYLLIIIRQNMTVQFGLGTQKH